MMEMMFETNPIQKFGLSAKLQLPDCLGVRFPHCNLLKEILRKSGVRDCLATATLRSDRIFVWDLF